MVITTAFNAPLRASTFSDIVIVSRKLLISPAIECHNNHLADVFLTTEYYCKQAHDVANPFV